LFDARVQAFLFNLKRFEDAPDMLEFQTLEGTLLPFAFIFQKDTADTVTADVARVVFARSMPHVF